MIPEIQTVLDEFHERSSRERAEMDRISRKEMWARIDEFLLPVGPDVGKLMNILVKASGAKTLVEFGTSHGYSAIWLAEAARETGGRLYSYDVHEGKQQFAREVLTRAGLIDHVEFVLGDADERIAELESPVDFALIDHWKSLYPGSYEALRPRLAPGAILVADNMTFPEDREGHIKEYRGRVAGTPGMVTVMLPVGNGIELSRYGG